MHVIVSFMRNTAAPCCPLLPTRDAMRCRYKYVACHSCPQVKKLGDVIHYLALVLTATLQLEELKALIAGIGLKTPSGHFDYATLEEKVDYAAELGLEYMICAVIPRPFWDSLDGFRQAAEHLNKIAAKAQAAGLKFGYHPHNYEYRPLPGGRGIDVVMKEFDPAIRLELDIYWAVEGGQNPLELMEKYSKRLELIHIKDRKPFSGFSYAPDEHGAHFTEAGSGTIDWKADLGEARRLGVKEFFVDQDGSDLPIEESLRVNWKYLSQLSF